LDEIRVTYTGLVSFVFGIITLIFQLGYFLILTRLLEQNEFGTWGLIRNLIVYGIISHQIISYWTTREVARGENSGVTAIFSSGILSLVGIVIFIIISIFTGENSNVDQNILFFAVILIPAMFFFHLLSSINLGWRPQAVAYGNLCLGIMQVSTALIFLQVLNMGIEGVIIAVFISYLVTDIVLALFSRKKIKDKIQINLLKRWIKLSWLPMYPEIGTVLARMDVIIFTIFTGSVAGIAFWVTSDMITRTIMQSSQISKGIYPKLLQKEENKKYLKGNLTILFYFTIPITALIISFSEPLMFVLNPIYQEAYLVVIILSLRFFLNVFSAVFRDSLLGIEKVDLNKESTFKDYFRSKLFFMPTLSIIQFGFYIVMLIIILIIFIETATVIELIIYWAIVILISQIFHTISSYILVRKHFKSILEISKIIKYFGVGIMIFGIIFVLNDNFLVYQNNIFQFLPILLLHMFIGFLGYFLITYLIDEKVRMLVKESVEEIKKKL